MTEPRSPATRADALIDELKMAPHPEGGHWRQTWIGSPIITDGQRRPTGTAILFLLRAGERSHWHRLDADEVWLYQGGDPLQLEMWSEMSSSPADSTDVAVLGSGGIGQGHVFQAHVPARAWQSAHTLGEWSLVGCTMAPGFTESGFELAPPLWSPRWSPR